MEQLGNSSFSENVGIMRFNPFHILQVDDLDSMALDVGVGLGTNINRVNVSLSDKVYMVDVDDHKPGTPPQYNTVECRYDVEEEKWTKVLSRKGRNYPNKMFQ